MVAGTHSRAVFANAAKKPSPLARHVLARVPPAEARVSKIFEKLFNKNAVRRPRWRSFYIRLRGRFFAASDATEKGV